jgi:hypothetical protein
MRKLKADEIEVKVKQIIKTEKWSGVVALLYKTARVDMDILDETYGAMNWQCDYKVVKDNMYCGIAVRDEKDNWVWKWDCGIESKSDGDGNEKKGEASDAFKRAGFKWGIGRELYTAPTILIPAEVVEKDGKKFLKDKNERYSVQTIEYDKDGNISSLVIVDRKGNFVFVWKKPAQKKGE